MAIRDPRALLPLKPLAFHVLLALIDDEQHGWALVRSIETRTGTRILPGNFYRLLRSLTAERLIEEIEPPKRLRDEAEAETGANAERRRYVRLTTFGREVARAEAHRLDALVAESRAKHLISARDRR